MALHIGSVNTFPVLVPHRGFSVFRIRQSRRLSRSRVGRLVMPAACAGPKEAKINLLDCICLCSELEVWYSIFAFYDGLMLHI